MKTKKTNHADLETKRPVFFSIGLVLSLAAVLLAFSWKTPVKPPVDFDPLRWEAPDELFIPPTSDVREIPKPPMITVEEFVLTDNDGDVDDFNPDLFNSDISAGEAILVQSYVETRKSEPEEKVIFDLVDEMPEFPGGERALLSFIRNSVKYPVIAQENGVFGTVFVRFVVNADGSICDAEVTRKIDDSLEREALRVINSMPKWKPGIQNGQAVKVRFHVPIRFVLQ
ncbi:energy transducer TonB [Gaoshiqia sp. Z1-71]|uniref:energy transducer TonB n=1 Tax=Gaoshiqia hydrogeniformans TaxID=3290090 RepID=UPI003BF8B32D